MIRVVIVDDHAVVRAGLEQLLSTAADIDVVATAGDGAEAAQVVADTTPDVVMMDLQMRGVDGVTATRLIHEQAPDVKVVVLTSFSDRDRILGALDAGAVGYLLKDADPRELLAGIRAAARGEAPLDPKAASVVLGSRRDTPETTLSERELDVLRLVAHGRSNKAIALELDISEKTVKAHLTSIFRQLGVFDRTQAALAARDRGLVRP